MDQTDRIETAFNQFVAEAERILAPTQWEIGRIASECKEATGKTDAELGERIGLKTDQVQQRRSVWDRFGTDSDTYRNLSWSHFYACLRWDDADSVLDVANSDGLSVAEMIRYHSVLHGKPSVREITAEVPAKELADPPLVQPSIQAIKPETTKRVDTKHEPIDPVAHLPEPVKPPPQPVVPDFSKWLEGLEQALSDESERKRMAQRLRKVANKLDPPSKFVPPTIEDVIDYASEKGWNGFDAEKYWNHHESKGWTMNHGKSMKSWQAAMVTAWGRGLGWCSSGAESSAKVHGMDWSEYD